MKSVVRRPSLGRGHGDSAGRRQRAEGSFEKGVRRQENREIRDQRSEVRGRTTDDRRLN